MYLNQGDFRRKYAPNQFLVLQSDTDDEHDHTYAHMHETRKLCDKHGVHYVIIDPTSGFHSGHWSKGLIGAQKATKTIGSKAFPKTCTDNLKIRPIYRYLEHFIGGRFGLEVGRKKAFIEYSKRFGKIKMLIGIAKGEEGRMADPSTYPKWMQRSIEVVYPLIELGLDRQACQDYLKSVGAEVPFPSNCKRCPYMSLQELLWLYRFYPKDYREWVEMEEEKINNNRHMGDKNLGVWGRRRLPEMLQEAHEKYGHYSDLQLIEYKFSHGHCVKSKY